MLYGTKHDEMTDVNELLKELESFTKTRNQMGGSMYWNICNDDSCKLANRIVDLAKTQPNYLEVRSQVESLLGRGNYC
jgi:L-lactate utilization protein LutB